MHLGALCPAFAEPFADPAVLLPQPQCMDIRRARAVAIFAAFYCVTGWPEAAGTSRFVPDGLMTVGVSDVCWESRKGGGAERAVAAEPVEQWDLIRRRHQRERCVQLPDLQKISIKVMWLDNLHCTCSLTCSKHESDGSRSSFHAARC